MKAMLCLSLLAFCSASAAKENKWQSFTFSKTVLQDGTVLGAILLPVRLDDQRCLMQFDTGAGRSILYQSLKLAPPHAQHATASYTLQIGTFKLPTPFLPQSPATAGTGTVATCKATTLIGTLGNDVLQDQAISLDLSQQRFRIGKNGTEAEPNDTIVDLEITAAHDGFVPMVKAEGFATGTQNLLFDTGSASMALGIFRESDWLQAVGRTSREGAQVITANAWGKPLTCFQAPITRNIRVGLFTLPEGAVASYCTKDNVAVFASRPEFGLLGLSPFADKTLVIDFMKSRLLIRANTTDTPGK
ncbi:hypothetical protein O0882_19670 [Janthinobacterium sp. SUN073]|uniref:hypothetical protein n=1 Tax=Janthinobacterium sp. SUN073 TaxID=3004102 RepID=UPI0025B061A2|nr:hypothetical protein [Janthinobacterium sp. SUN073]MDN2698541.1 hypothetical protein [Janthinobacterium sp. SUN073]